MFGNIFFDPDDKMIEWLIKEVIKNRTVFDIGCGTGELLFRLKEKDYHGLVGVDPFTDYFEFQKEAFNRTNERIHLFQNSINDAPIVTLLTNLPKGTGVGLLCRPCHHHSLTKGAYDIFSALDIPLYYIGLEKNLEQDLEDYDIPYVELIHEGSSEDNEKVYRLV